MNIRARKLLRRWAVIMVLGWAGAGAIQSSAFAIIIIESKPADWSNVHVLQGTATATPGRPENPLVLVGFNPQPEPPAGLDSVLNLRSPGMPTLGLTGVTAPQTFRLLFALGATSGAFSIAGSSGPGPNSLDLVIAGPNGNYLVEFGFTTSSGGELQDPGSLVGFNPQPEPPAGPGDSALFGMDFGFTSLSDVFVTLHITNPNGDEVTFSRVPEPGTLAIFGVALAGLGLMRRRRKAA